MGSISRCELSRSLQARSAQRRGLGPTAKRPQGATTASVGEPPPVSEQGSHCRQTLRTRQYGALNPPSRRSR
jgi:hypothetical protein